MLPQTIGVSPVAIKTQPVTLGLTSVTVIVKSFVGVLPLSSVPNIVIVSPTA